MPGGDCGVNPGYVDLFLHEEAVWATPGLPFTGITFFPFVETATASPH